MEAEDKRLRQDMKNKIKKEMHVESIQILWKLTIDLLIQPNVTQEKERDKKKGKWFGAGRNTMVGKRSWDNETAEEENIERECQEGTRGNLEERFKTYKARRRKIFTAQKI